MKFSEMKRNLRLTGFTPTAPLLLVATLLAAATIASITPVGAAPTAVHSLGINDHIIWRTHADQDVAFAQYTASNTKYLRVGADWNVLEQVQGTYNANYLDRLDYFFTKSTAAGLRVLLIAAYAPAWANGGHPGGGYAPTPEHTADYADFCEFLLRRYAAKPYVNASGQHTLEAIELWNEPDLADAFFKPYNRETAAAGTAYGNLVAPAGARLKAVRTAIGAPEVLIGAPVVSDVHGVCWAPPGLTCWMDAFYAVPNVTAAYDIFCWHSYWQSAGTSWLPPELPAAYSDKSKVSSVMGKLTAPASNAIWAKMTAHGDNLKPNWLTEIGGAARSDLPEHKSQRLLSLGEQAAHLSDVIATLNAGKVTNLQRVYWYDLIDDCFSKGDQQVYGLTALNASRPISYDGGGVKLTAAVFTPKPAYAVYKDAVKDYLMLDSNAGTAASGAPVIK